MKDPDCDVCRWQCEDNCPFEYYPEPGYCMRFEEREGTFDYSEEALQDAIFRLGMFREEYKTKDNREPFEVAIKAISIIKRKLYG